jgi:ATP-dependent DNA ligase
MSLRELTRPGLGIIEPCLPSPAKPPPSGPGWIHEIKHDGFRILARRDAAGVRLITRAGNDFSSRFPFIAVAVGKLPVRSCLIDGEAIVCDENGLADFELIRRQGASPAPSFARSICLSLTDGICAVNRLRRARHYSPSFSRDRM